MVSKGENMIVMTKRQKATGIVILCVLTVIACLILSISTFAETVVLKSGKTVEGKLIEKTDKYIKIDFQGVPLTYYLDEIERVDENKLTSRQAEEKVSDNNDTEWYNNADFNFMIKKLPGWGIHENKSPRGAFTILTLGFDKVSQEGNFICTLIIFVKKLDMDKFHVKSDEEFIPLADSMTDAATERFDKLTLNRKTIFINNVLVREAKFEYKYKGDSFFGQLMYFKPTKTKNCIIEISTLLKCKLKEYPVFEKDLNRALNSIKIE